LRQLGIKREKKKKNPKPLDIKEGDGLPTGKKKAAEITDSEREERESKNGTLKNGQKNTE